MCPVAPATPVVSYQRGPVGISVGPGSPQLRASQGLVIRVIRSPVASAVTCCSGMALARSGSRAVKAPSGRRSPRRPVRDAGGSHCGAPNGMGFRPRIEAEPDPQINKDADEDRGLCGQGNRRTQAAIGTFGQSGAVNGCCASCGGLRDTASHRPPLPGKVRHRLGRVGRDWCAGRQRRPLGGSGRQHGAAVGGGLPGQAEAWSRSDRS